MSRRNLAPLGALKHQIWTGRVADAVRPAAALDVLKQQAWAGRRIDMERLERRRLLAASIDDRVLMVEGSGGNDVISVTRSGGDVTVDINGAESDFNPDDFDRVIVSGLDGGDRIAVGDNIAGTSLLGGAGNDTLMPGDGNGADFHTEDDRNDYLSGGDGNDVVQYLAAATFSFRQFQGYLAADGTSPTPYILVTGPNEYDDRIADDIEHFIGGPGVDTFYINRNITSVPLNKELTLEGGDGNDIFEAGNGLRTTQFGQAGDDRLETHGTSDETLIGGDGNDLFDFGPSDRSTSLSGGAGTDGILLADGPGTTVDLRLYPDVENATLIHPQQTAIGNDLDNFITGAEEVTLTGGDGNDTLVASRNDDDGDLLEGGAGDDLLLGLNGDDTLDGGSGTDTLIDGSGNDTLLNGEVETLVQIDNGTLRVDGTMVEEDIFIRADGSGGLVVSTDGEDETFNIDHVTRIELIGNDGSDRLELDGSVSIPALLTGGLGDDTLIGGAGNDQLIGDAGLDPLTLFGDSLSGNGGDDTLDGGSGPDEMRGGSGRDTIDYSSRTNGIIVGLDDFTDDGEFFEGDFAAPDVEIVIGGSGHDRIGGNDADNELHGMGGYDTIGGGGGDDSIFGWHGNDVLHGDDGSDYIEAGAGHDNVYGNDGADTLLGLAGNDWLFTSGDDFEDSIRGGFGTDFADGDPFDELHSSEELI